MGDATEQVAWIVRVLGVVMPDAAPATSEAPAKAIPPLTPIWRAAKEDVDAGIGKLQDALRATEDEDLDVIVKFGLYGIGKGENVALMAALMDADKAATPQALVKVAGAVDDYQSFLASAPIVGLLEDNPFGAPVPMRKVLGAALTEIAGHVAA